MTAHLAFAEGLGLGAGLLLADGRGLAEAVGLWKE